jgi:hypothetical protein
VILDGKEKNIDGLWDYLSGDSCSKNLLHLSACTQHQKINSMSCLNEFGNEGLDRNQTFQIKSWKI